MKRATLAIYLVCLICLASACVAEGLPYPSNLELIGQAVKQAANSMKVAPPERSVPVLEIRAGEGDEASWLLESVLKEHLLGLGWQIKADSQTPDSSSSGGYLLKMRVATLGLEYGRSWRRYLFGSKVVERIARVALYYELIDRADGRVLVSSDVTEEAVDVVPASMLKSLSTSKYSFTSPKLEKGQWDRYLEGGLVIAIIGVLVYLFYSNKTAS
jgi:hypothetical protein